MDEMQTQTIVAGVDGSEHSADALALANAIAASFGVEVAPVLVHPFGDFERALGDGRDGDAVRQLADSVHAQMRELGTPIEDRRLTLVADRSAARGLQRIAEERQALLITIGASQRSRLGRVLLGGTAEHLISGAPFAVAVAPAGYSAEPGAIETIGVAFDGSPESRLALDWATSLAQRSAARVRILSVHQPLISPYPAFETVPMVAREETLREFMGRQQKAAALELRRAGVGVDGSQLTGNPTAVLEEQSGEVDLMVSGSRGSGPTRAVLLGSVSAGLVRHAASPVVVLSRGAEVGDMSDADSSAEKTQHQAMSIARTSQGSL
jgi:nucleotide-binding universal stress UspA family protein